MKKIILTLLFTICILGAAFSQGGHFSAGLEFSQPLGDGSEFFNTGFGPSVRYETTIVKKLNVFATAAFLYYTGKDYFVTDSRGMLIAKTAPNISFVPIQGGLKYYFQESNYGFYVSGEAGYFIASGGVKNSYNDFGYTPGIGSKLEKLDLSIHYNILPELHNIGVRIAYVF